LEESAASQWEAEVEGTPLSLIAADNRLFVSTLEGRIYSFASAEDAPGEPQVLALPARGASTDDVASAKVASLLKASDARAGYALVVGAADGAGIHELVRQSELRITVVESNAQAADRLRQSLQSQGIGGNRAAVLAADPLEVELPPYLANLIVAEELPRDERERTALVEKLFNSLRPYGGVACLRVPGDQADALQAKLSDRSLHGAVWKSAGEWTLLVRGGALPESANWTHEHADAANTRVSKDKRVKTPLGVLWFGGSSNEDILPRHGHGPQPQVVDGRLFIEGMDMIRAADIYTGRVLWEAKLPGVGALYDNCLSPIGIPATCSIHPPESNAQHFNCRRPPEQKRRRCGAT
jgi:hypothetical protein